MEKNLKILIDINQFGFIYRKFMSSDEIKISNNLVKEGLLYKGKTDEKNSTIAFFITDKGKEWIENNKHS